MMTPRIHGINGLFFLEYPYQGINIALTRSFSLHCCLCLIATLAILCYPLIRLLLSIWLFGGLCCDHRFASWTGLNSFNLHNNAPPGLGS
jgi:hypothetical protein